MTTLVGRGVTATGVDGEAGGDTDGNLRRATNVVSAVNDQFLEVVFGLYWADAWHKITEGRSFTPDDTASARELGERRADQGMPFESMVRSYHVSERIMFGTLLATHDDLGSDDLRSTVSLLHKNNGALARGLLPCRSWAP